MLSQRLRFPGILDATPYLHAGYRCCAACAFAHLYTSFLNWRRGEACAKDNNVYSVWGDDTIWKMAGQLCSRAEDNKIIARRFIQVWGLGHVCIVKSSLIVSFFFIRLNPLFLVCSSCGPAFIGGKRPEEPEDTTNSNAHRRIPEGKYQCEQITGNTQCVVATPWVYQHG